MPRTGLSSEEIRERAVERAEEAIRKHGYERFRLVDIARELKVSHVALYKHFSDKAALLDSVSEKWLARIDTALARVCAASTRTPEQRIYDFFLTLHRAKCEKVGKDPELYKAFDSAAEMAKPFVVRHLETMGRLLERLVREMLAAQDGRAYEARRVARMLLDGTVSFHHPKLVAERAGEKREAELRRLLDTLLRGVRR